LAAKDGGQRLASIAELALRAQQWAIGFHLQAAAQALHADRGQTSGPPLFTGPVQSIRDLHWHVCSTFVRANERWLVFRWPPRHGESAEEAEARRARYRSELRAAAREVRALESDSQVSYFLRHAPAREPLRAPCAAIMVAIRLAIDTDPDAISHQVPRPLDAAIVGGAP
jgi:hypothetical protein